MKLLDALSDYFCTQSGMLSSSYDWKFSLAKFPLANYELRGSNAYERSHNLRTDLNNFIAENSPSSKELQFWYVREWGGVRGNKLSTLEDYIQTSDADLIALKSRGIATWSKILSIRNPSVYAIYDARVALALNSFQKAMKVSEAIMFPLLPSQNRKFVKDATDAIERSKFFTKSAGDNFYEQYLDLLVRATKNIEGVNIQDAEMILFSKSNELCRVWNN